jgi:hypothetical protein
MNTFKIDDWVWFFYTHSGRDDWSEATIIYPSEIEIRKGRIVHVDANKDQVHVYVPGDSEIVRFGYVFHQDYFFESKEKAVETMQSYLNTLEQRL